MKKVKGDMSQLGVALLKWYDQNKRDLPWRQTSDPYQIWVSEIMLQQTRVEAVLEKYRRFIVALPRVVDLAVASEEDVLGLWQGLGYYSRARNLHKAAKQVSEQYDGVVPRDYGVFRSLSGVGEYTANAVFSIAFQEPYLAMDGNLLRVASRLFAVSENITTKSAKNHLKDLLEPYLSRTRPGDFNQALMDLASAICLPKKPRCQGCPLIWYCQAEKLSMAEALPNRSNGKAVPVVPVTIFVFYNKNGEILIRRRNDGAFLQGLWELPWVEQVPTEQVSETSPKYQIRDALTSYTFSHKQWLIQLRQCSVSQLEMDTSPEKWVDPILVEPTPNSEYQWVSVDQLGQYPMSTVFRHVFSLV